MVATKKADGPEDIFRRETAAGTANQPGLSPYQPSADEDPTLGGRKMLAKSEAAAAPNNNEAPSKQKVKSTDRLLKSVSFFFKHKVLITGSGVALVIIGLIILFILSLMKVPNLGADVTGIEFTRLLRQFGNTAININQEALAYQTAGDQAAGKSASLRELLAKEYVGQKPLLNKLQGLAVNKIADNLKVADNIRLNYAQGNRVLKSVSLLDDAGNVVKSVAIPEPSALDRIIPNWRFFARGLTGKDAKLSSQLIDLIAAGFNNGEISRSGVLLRTGIIAQLLREEAGINLIAFDAAALAKYATLTPQQADAANLQDSYKQVSGNSAPDPHSSIPGQEDAAKEAYHVVDEGVQKIEEAAKPKTLIKKAGDAARKYIADATSSPFAFVAKVGDPLYMLALTMCTVYEGSTERSGPTVNSNIFDLQREAYRIFTVGDQEKSGGPVGLLTAVGAVNDQLGDITDSIPYKKANGLPVNTSDAMASPEANGLGEFTLINASFPKDKISQSVANMINPVGQKVCGGLLSPAGVITAIAAQIVILVATLGSGSTVDGAANVATRVVADDVIGDATAQVTARSIAAVIGQKIAAEGFWGRAGTFLLKEGLKLGGIIAGTDALTYLAQWWVMGQAHLMWSGLEQHTDLANAVGAGGNLIANQHEQTVLFGRPLTCAEINENDQLDKTYVASIDQSRSFTDRYISVNNPHSLLIRSASMVQFGIHNALGPNGTLANLLLLPLQSFGSLIGSITGIATAATPCTPENYGNIQFGWSKSEEDLIASSDSYLPLENQKILDQSGQAKNIANDYSYCFGYDYNANGDGSLDPTDPNSNLVLDITGDNASDGKNGSIGELEANGDIVRTSTGDIVPNEGNCSPNNLGIHNPKYGDLVFRWRLARRYDSALSQLSDLQTVTK